MYANPNDSKNKMTNTNNTLPKDSKLTVNNLNILQLNTSNADWSTKKHELLSTIVDNKADVTIIS